MQVLIDWILEQGTTSDDLGALLTGIGERLLESGVPVQRASLDLPTIDPNSRAISYKWWRDRPTAVQTLPHGIDHEGVFQRSVVYHLLSTGLDIGRWRLDRREGSQFELLRELRAQGLTDYVLRLAGFGDSTSPVKGVAFSIATDRAGGFSDSALSQASRITPALRLAAIGSVLRIPRPTPSASTWDRTQPGACLRARFSAAEARESQPPSCSPI